MAESHFSGSTLCVGGTAGTGVSERKRKSRIEHGVVDVCVEEKREGHLRRSAYGGGERCMGLGGWRWAGDRWKTLRVASASNDGNGGCGCG